MYQTMSYDEQLNMKAGQVKKLLDTAISSAGQVDAEGKPDYVFEALQAVQNSGHTAIKWNFLLEMIIWMGH